MRFVDTNVLLYAVSFSDAEHDKRGRAIEVLTRDDLALSVQVMAEFYNQATHRRRTRVLSPEQALAFLSGIEAAKIQPVTVEVFELGVAISEQVGLSYWDGAILAAAKLAGCDAVYSEDMSAEQDYDGLRVINPFAGLWHAAPRTQFLHQN